jgi:hypothetical protein
LENVFKRLIVGLLSKYLVPRHGAVQHVEHQAASRRTLSPGHGENLLVTLARFNKKTPVPTPDPFSAREPEKIERIGERLLQQFGGCTFFPQPTKGTWKMGPVIFLDEIVLFRTHDRDVRAARRFFRQLKVELRQQLQQEEILIVGKHAEAL